MAEQTSLNRRINAEIDKAAEDIMQMLMNSQMTRHPNNIPRRFHELALEIVGMTASRLEWLSENDDNNPQYTLYYNTLSTLCMKACVRAADKCVF